MSCISCSKTRPPSRLGGRLGAIRTSAAATLPQSANKIEDQLFGPFKRLIGLSDQLIGSVKD